MREPIVVFIGRDLFLLRTVRFHPPDLHQAGAVGAEINRAAIRRIFRAVIEAGRGREPFFFAAIGGDGVNVELTFSFRAVRECLAVRRPSVPARRTELRDQPRRAAFDGQHVNTRNIFRAGLIADDELGAVGRNAVVVVAMDGRAGVDALQLTAGYRQLTYATAVV